MERSPVQIPFWGRQCNDPRGEANLWINSELGSIWTEEGSCRLVISDPPEGIKAMLKLAADNNLEISWQQPREIRELSLKKT